MLLSFNQLRFLVDAGVITNSGYEYINAASIDITLGSHILVESPSTRKEGKPREVTLRDREPLAAKKAKIPKKGYLLDPGEFILAHSAQVFNIPLDISADYKLKSSMARIGLEHLTAGWIDAGWHGSVLTLELKNVSQHHSIRLFEGDRIGQVVFFQHNHVPAEAGYGTRGRYNNDLSVSGVKE